jgi:hypothetical protein
MADMRRFGRLVYCSSSGAIHLLLSRAGTGQRGSLRPSNVFLLGTSWPVDTKPLRRGR